MSKTQMSLGCIETRMQHQVSCSQARYPHAVNTLLNYRRMTGAHSRELSCICAVDKFNCLETPFSADLF